MPFSWFLSPSHRTLQSLFMQTHGLRDPLTAIRWGTHRLYKDKRGVLSDEQRSHLIEHVYQHSKILTVMVESMVLLAELRENLHQPAPQDICMRDLLQSLTGEFTYLEGTTWKLNCPHVHVKTDRRILEASLRTLLILRTGFGKEPMNILIEVEPAARSMAINIYSSMVFPVLHAQERNELIGGMSGFLLSLGSTLTEALRGRIDVQRKVQGNFVPLQIRDEIDPKELTLKQYKLILRLPVATKLTEGKCVPGKSSAVAL